MNFKMLEEKLEVVEYKMVLKNYHFTSTFSLILLYNSF